RLKDLTKIDDQRCFLTEEAAADSYVYKSFTKPLKAQTKKKNKDKPLRIKPGILNYSWYHWKRNIERYLKYPQFYKDTSSICLNYDENESTGTLARFAPPNLKEPYCLKLVTLPKLEEEISLNSKLPVSQDQNIIKLLETHQFNAVISSSGLKQIIDYTNTKIKWIIPVVIKDISINDIKKKVVFIDKVLPKVNPSYQDLKYYAYKQLLKSNLCQYKAFSFPTEETPVENSTGNRENSEKAPDENLEKTDEAQKGQSKQRLIHHNVSYKIWSVQKTDNQNTLMKSKAKDKEIKLLIRCKLDACELTEQGALYPVIIKPKIEQQLQYGANIATKSELAREWASLFFRVYSNLYRECEESKIDSEAKQAWLPVDVNYILPVHEENGQIPGTFQGFDNYKHDLQVKKKK
ncbi:uncharacterized protein BDFB_001399, partial [Asbolus verrucosus]